MEEQVGYEEENKRLSRRPCNTTPQHGLTETLGSVLLPTIGDFQHNLACLYRVSANFRLVRIQISVLTQADVS
jgi:hypothetical protein